MHTTVFRGGGLVLKQRLHFLLPFDEERLDLRLLIGGQVEFASEALELSIGIHPHSASTRAVGWWAGLILIGWWGRCILCESGTGAADGEKASEGQS